MSWVDIDDLNFHIDGFSVSADPQGNRATNAEIFQLFGQIEGISDRQAIGAGDDIPDRAGRGIIARKAARSAGEPGRTRAMITPSIPSRSASASSPGTMPMPGVAMRPALIS